MSSMIAQVSRKGPHDDRSASAPEDCSSAAVRASSPCNDYDVWNGTPPQAGTAPDASDQDAALFVSETIADGRLMAAGEHSTKTWTIKNAGSAHWLARHLTRIGLRAAPGLIATPQSVEVPNTPPGESITSCWHGRLRPGCGSPTRKRSSAAPTPPC
jgi:hypothetical protein